MTELEIANELVKRYSDSTNLNEADTRLQIIDTLLFDVLKWPKHLSAVEKIIKDKRADYVLYNSSKIPQLVIESKRENSYFELPQNFNSEKLFQRISVEKLLTSENIKRAILQVKEYAEDIACNYASICNGHVWVIFKIYSPNIPWKKLPAFVIKNLLFFQKEYTTALNLLGYFNVVKKKSLIYNIGVNKKLYAEIFFPKNNIRTYNTPVNSNQYASILDNISRKYLGPIPISEIEFMKRCYVTNKGHYDNLQKNVKGIVFDSLTPYFKNLGVKDFFDDKKGGAFGLKITEIIKKENLDNVMILFGGRGSGKSTFLKRFLFHLRPRELELYSIISLVDLIDSSQTKDELVTEIWQKVLNGIDQDNLRSGDQDEIIDLFEEEFNIFKKQLLKGLENDDPKYLDYKREFVKEKVSDVKGFSEKISLYWKNHNKGLIIFLDNMDQLPQELQDVSFLTAIEIAKKLSCLVIISMREERYYNAKTNGVLDAYHTPGFHLTSPVIPDVIFKRILFIIDKLEYTEDLDFNYGIENDSQYQTILNFFNICKRQVKNYRTPLSKFLRYATHGDVRQALDFFKGFLTSGYTNIKEMAPHPYWEFQIHQVIKPMMIPDRFFYDEKFSKIPNIYQLRNDVNSSHFSGIRILDYLHKRAGESKGSGFIDAKFLLQMLENKYGNKDDFEKNIDVFIRKGIIEVSNRLEEYSEKVDQVKITAFGEYILNFLAFNFAYLDLICLDCGLFDEQLNNKFVMIANKELEYYYSNNFMKRIKLRIERVEDFINYLGRKEREEITNLNLSDEETVFSEKLKIVFEEEKGKILKSAKKKKDLETEYN